MQIGADRDRTTNLATSRWPAELQPNIPSGGIILDSGLRRHRCECHRLLLADKPLLSLTWCCCLCTCFLGTLVGLLMCILTFLTDQLTGCQTADTSVQIANDSLALLSDLTPSLQTDPRTSQFVSSLQQSLQHLVFLFIYSLFKVSLNFLKGRIQIKVVFIIIMY